MNNSGKFWKNRKIENISIKYNKFNYTNRIFKNLLKNIKTLAIFEKNFRQLVKSLRKFLENL